jgi:hypothetical protein
MMMRSLHRLLEINIKEESFPVDKVRKGSLDEEDINWAL